jgi:hypothetical protein
MLELHTLIIIILLVVFFVVTLAILKPLFSSDFQMSWRERWCQITVVLNRYIHATDKFSFPVACSTERLVIGEKDFKKAMTTDDSTVEEGGSRYVLDAMRRCKFLVGGENAIALTRNSQCYICYTLETDASVPILPAKAINHFALTKKTEDEELYVIDLQSPGLSNHYHTFVVNPESGSLQPRKKYAVVYVDHEKPSEFVGWSKPLAGCVIGAGVLSFVTGGLGTPALYACAVAGGAGVGSSVYDYFGKETNRIVLTDLYQLGQFGSSECEGYAY